MHAESIQKSSQIQFNVSKYLLYGFVEGKKYVDCSEILRNVPSAKNEDGVYTIYPDHINKKDVFCDMTTEGGGWTVSTFVFVFLNLMYFCNGDYTNIKCILIILQTCQMYTLSVRPDTAQQKADVIYFWNSLRANPKKTLG